MSTARALLLEIKRQNGDVNAPAPDETDLLAFLNRTLSNLWNYGARLDSPVLYKHELLTSSTGRVSVPAGIMKIRSVREHATGLLIPEMTLDYAAVIADRLDANNRRYIPALAEIDVYPLDIAISADVVYMPGFVKLADRDATLPFPSELDNAVIAMTLAQIAGKDVDFMMANAPYGNAVSRFFRGRGISAMCGRGPW